MADAARMSRRGLARRLTVQAVYQWLVNASSAEQMLSQFQDDPGIGRADGAYFGELLIGTVRHIDELTPKFSAHLDRPLEQLDPVERAILTVAAYELVYCPAVPWRVVVNEAVNLAKMFGADDSYRYINGVLDKLAHDVRSADISEGL